MEVETTAHYLHHCPNYSNERKTLLENIINVLHFGDTALHGYSNTNILNTTINKITSIKRFDDFIFTFSEE